MEKHIHWLRPEEKELEKKVLAEYSPTEVRRHLEYLAALTRRPGTEDELKAATYIINKLEEYGVYGKIYEFDAYIGEVGEVKLDILSPMRKSFPCEIRGFTAPTPPEGIEGELISLGKGLAEDYRGLDIKGKIVLASPGGLAATRMPASKLAEDKGAVAQIHIAMGKTRDIHMGQIRYTWGNPTPDTIDKVPKIPLVSICNEDGKYLIELTKKGPVAVRINTNARRGYTRVREPIGTLRGTEDPDKFVLFGGHYCSWYKGATDNAAANSMLLEIARIFSLHRKSLGRGIKFAWWTCHEQGTYAGSTWYADNFWEDLRDNAVAYFVVDGLGRGDAPGFVPKSIEINNSEEIRKFNEAVIKEIFHLPVKSKRLNKSGDQSFWGVGVPSVFGKPTFKAGETATPGDDEVWYSHTPEDTLDKVHMENIFNIPFKFNTISLLRLCNNQILPLEFVTVAEAFAARFNDLQESSGDVLDLSSLLTQAAAFRMKAEALNRGIAKNLSVSEKKGTGENRKKKFKAINDCLMDLSRILMPLLSSQSGKYGQDPIGSKFKPIPILEPLEQLNLLDRGGELYKAWRTSLLRDCNRVSDALNSANRILDSTLEETKMTRDTLTA